MKESKDGFFIPHIDTGKCIKCGKCVNVCHVKSDSIFFKGPLNAYACWSTCKSDRENSSSGGAFSILARSILNDGGVVYGASMSSDLKVRHISIERNENLYQLQGSKYVQSFLGDTYKEVREVLSTGRKVLFTGTPCQIAGLLSFLKKRYDNLYTCDVVCHGVPSQTAFDIYTEKIGIKGKCSYVGFRYTKGWGFKMTTVNNYGKQRTLSPDKAYYTRAFNAGLMSNEPCYTCIYARKERISDITIADYWGIGTALPFKHPTHKGISLVLVNDKRILPFLSGEASAMEERPIEEAVAGNFNLRHATKRPQGRDTYFEDSKVLSIKALSRKYEIRASVKDYLRIVKQFLYSFLYR